MGLSFVVVSLDVHVTVIIRYGYVPGVVPGGLVYGKPWGLLGQNLGLL